MVVLESAGARYLRPYGASNDPMPNLSNMANSAIVFENAYSVYPESIKGLFSVLCSRYPAMDTNQDSYSRIVTPGIASILKAAGYHTALFHSGRFMYLGMDAVVRGRFALPEGYARWDAPLPAAGPAEHGSQLAGRCTREK